MGTVYLTFDDGPLPGTDDVLAVLAEKGVKGSLFMVANHASTPWRKQRLEDAHASPHAEVANHSLTHADLQYRAYYREPDQVVTGFKQASVELGLDGGGTVVARLPGRNTWRVDSINKTDAAHGADSSKAADGLAAIGYEIYGWDVEWTMDGSGDAAEAPAAVLAKIEGKLNAGSAKAGHVILLTHDTMFRDSRGGKAKLVALIDLLVAKGHVMEFASKY